MLSLWVVLPISVLSFYSALSAYAETELPYSVRTKGYSGWSTTVRGDIRTLGMAGAMTGLADTFLATGQNPAGLAMTMDSVAAQIASNSVQDQDVQDFNSKMETTNYGTSANVYPWGFSFGFWTPERVGQDYFVPNANDTGKADISVREIRASLARIFLQDRLSIGGSLIFGRAQRQLEFLNHKNLSHADHPEAFGINLGAMYRLPHRYLIGLSYSSQITYGADYTTDSSASIANFRQKIVTPPRVSAGLGWIPNRYFKAGFSLNWIGATPDVALLRDERISVGEASTLQPRLGASYLFADFKNMKAEISTGTYFEDTRIQNTSNRIHHTFGIEFNPWIFNVGFALDRASGYQNFLFALGVDLIRVLQRMDLVPPELRPPYSGWIPNPFVNSEVGLPRTLVKNWNGRSGTTPVDVLEITKKIPEKLEDKIRSLVGPSPKPHKKRR